MVIKKTRLGSRLFIWTTEATRMSQLQTDDQIIRRATSFPVMRDQFLSQLAQAAFVAPR